MSQTWWCTPWRVANHKGVWESFKRRPHDLTGKVSGGDRHGQSSSMVNDRRSAKLGARRVATTSSSSSQSQGVQTVQKTVEFPQLHGFSGRRSCGHAATLRPAGRLGVDDILEHLCLAQVPGEPITGDELM